ncbi:type II secretion system F family protein [Patescibacteria group bacterium]
MKNQLPKPKQQTTYSSKEKPRKPNSTKRLASNLDVILFAENLSMMLESGIGIIQAFSSIIEQTANKPLKKAFIEIQKEIASGHSLSETLALYPGTFPPFFIKMIEAGEKSGTLTKTLNELAKQTEKDYELREKIKTAMLYPSIVLGLAVVIGIGISFFILPRLVKLFESFKIDLPITTQILIIIGKIIGDWGIWILLGITGLVLILAILFKTSGFKPLKDSITLSIPIIGKLIRYTTLSRFGFLLSTLLESGVPIDESLEAVQKTILSTPYIKMIKTMQNEIREGKSFKITFENKKHLMKGFPLLAKQLMVSGEESGKLSMSLRNLASFYERESSSMARRMETILEPILLIIVGIVVTFIALSIITPIYQITGSINN